MSDMSNAPKLYLANWTTRTDFDAYKDGADDAADVFEYCEPRGQVFTSVSRAMLWAHHQWCHENELTYDKVPDTWEPTHNGNIYVLHVGFDDIYLYVRQVKLDMTH